MDQQRAADIFILLGLRKSTVNKKLKTYQSGDTEGITKVRGSLVPPCGRRNTEQL